MEALLRQIEVARHERLIEARRSAEAKLAPFKSDGCSGGMSAGWGLVIANIPSIAEQHGKTPPWEHCCIAHDREYHLGAPDAVDADASFKARRSVDDELRRCVMTVGERRAEALMSEYGISRADVDRLYRLIADTMYRATRLGGGPCTGLSWRWGFGWPSC